MIEVFFQNEKGIKETLSLESDASGFSLLKRNPEKEALAMRQNAHLVDLSTPLQNQDTISWVLRSSQEGLELIRHSTAHLLAQAICELYQDAQITIGPVIEDGFYYDIDFGTHISKEELPLIEKKMKSLAKKNSSIKRNVWKKEDLIKHFQDMGQHYKVQIIEALEEGSKISTYEQGNFMDLCRGPHLPSTQKLGAFKLTKIAGAYWRGDSKGPMLQRIYGTAWRNQEELDAYLHRIEEAKKRDHRILGKTLNIFHTQEEAPGMPFWHENGTFIFRTIQEYMRRRLEIEGYGEIMTPILMDRSLWERSGHWEKFQENMFSTEMDERIMALKPMNCPGAIQIYNQKPKSYRDLPFRVGEFGVVHRFEASGTLHGLMRVRSFTQDDAHIFCTLNQLKDEIKACVQLILSTYQDFGFHDIAIKISTRPEKRIGSDEVWNQSEAVLFEVLKELKIPFEVFEGEGAFYGPKYEFQLKDSIGRIWQCGTVQVDFSMPERLDARYTDSDGTKKPPVMIHRAVLGSLERFIGILIEHFEGKLPLWLIKEQVRILPVSEKTHDYTENILKKLKSFGVRAEADFRNERLGQKIREATLEKVPFTLILGSEEESSSLLSYRSLKGEEKKGVSIDSFTQIIKSLSAFPKSTTQKLDKTSP